MNQASDHSRSTIIVQALHSALGLFKVRREERRLAWGALLYALVLNTMVVCHYWEWFSQVTDGYRKLVLRHFHISGFDPITYLVLNDWSAAYNIYRHPLLAFFMWIPAQVNRLIILATGVNFAQVLTALLLVAATFYAVLFLFASCARSSDWPRPTPCCSPFSFSPSPTRWCRSAFPTTSASLRRP